MENATKALEMAASVLIGMLIIGALVFTYTKISDIKQTEQDSLSSQQAVDFNKKFEAYNRNGVYGSELLSLANLIIDYNNKEANETEGYKEIELTVSMKVRIDGAQYFNDQEYNASELTSAYNSLAKEIANKGKKTYKGNPISYWANSSSELNANFSDSSWPTLKMMQVYIQNYKNLVAEQEDMARKTFKCTKVEYDKNNGRITKMCYSET